MKNVVIKKSCEIKKKRFRAGDYTVIDNDIFEKWKHLDIFQLIEDMDEPKEGYDGSEFDKANG